MGRKRLHDKHLPLRVYLDHGTYWFRPKDAKPVNLGRDLAEMFAKYGTIVGAQWSGRTVGDVIDRYRAEVLPTKRSAQTRKDQEKELGRLKAVFGDLAPDRLRSSAIAISIAAARKTGSLRARQRGTR